MRLSLLAMTTSLAVAAIAAPTKKRDENAENLDISLSIGKRNDALKLQVDDDGNLSILKRDVANEADGVDLGLGLNVGKRNAGPNEDDLIGISFGTDGSVSAIRRDVANEDDGISVSVGASVD